MLIVLLTHVALAQTTPEAAVQAALQHHPLTRVAALEVQAKKYGEKAAINLPNPELNVESPTGTFYAVGVLQSFEFPTVYTRQKQVAKAATALAIAGQRVSENDLRYTVRTLYLEAQVAEFQAVQWRQRDSLYRAIVAAAARQFSAGEIDYLQKILAENEAGKVQQEWLATQQNVVSVRQQLATYTGLQDLGKLLPLTPEILGLQLSTKAENNPSVAYDQQAVQVAEKQVALAKSRALPNFSLGYLNQGERVTPIDYRFRASIGIPIWAGQYRAGANAAKSDAAAALARVEAQRQSISMEYQRVQVAAAAALVKVQYHQNEALPRSRSIIETAMRLRTAGQVDYVTFLRTIDEAFSIQQAYTEQVAVLNQAWLQMLYLSGN